MPKKNGQPTKKELLQIELQKKIDNVDYLLENAHLLNWSKICSEFYLSDEVLIKCSRYIKWTKIFKTRTDLSTDVLIKNYKKIGIFNVIVYQKNITEELIEVMKPKMTNVEWSTLSRRFSFPISFIEKYYDNLFLGSLKIDHLTKEEKEKLDALKTIKTLS